VSESPLAWMFPGGVPGAEDGRKGTYALSTQREARWPHG